MSNGREMHVLQWWPDQPRTVGYWGVTTSSIDWCEENYNVTRYIAEFMNTISNLVFMLVAGYAIKKSMDERLPFPLMLCEIGMFLIGLGSLAFHATLRYDCQLFDELPMIYLNAFTTYVTFDRSKSKTNPSSVLHQVILTTSVWLYAVGVTVVYLLYPNPIFHHVMYGGVLLTSNAKTFISISQLPTKTKNEKKNKADIERCNTAGFFIFLSAFGIWNIDNLFCQHLVSLRKSIGYPWAYLLELHAWWHIGTGIGAYLMIVGIQSRSLNDEEGPDSFEIKWVANGIWPYVSRIDSTPSNAHLPRTPKRATT